MKPSIKFISFQAITNHVLEQMLQGKAFTKSMLNSLIPDGMNKSSGDIIRVLHEHGSVEMSYSPMKQGVPAFWFINAYHRNEYLSTPERYMVLKAQREEETSLKRDISCIQGIINRRGRNFINDIDSH